MRVLCSFVGGAGHLVPQLPLLRALYDAGHELALVGRESGTRSAPDGLFARIVSAPDRRSSVSAGISPLVPVDREAELAVVADHFAGEAARQAAALVEPELHGMDVLVCDELDFGAMAAASVVGVPTVVVSVIASGALVRRNLITDALQRIRLDLGLSHPIRFQGDLFVISFTESMRAPGVAPPETCLWMRPDRGSEPATDGSIVATLGTEFNTESGDLFDRILGALAVLDRPAVVAVGNDLDPARFGPQPSHVRVHQYVDFDLAIPRASVVLHHGGSGMFLRSILGGASQIVFPMGADQPFNADRVQQLALGDVLDPLAATSSDIAARVRNLLDDTDTQNRVAALRSEVLALPEAATVVSRVETLVEETGRW